MNFVFIAGHLGADPESRFTSSGKKVTTLRVAARARKGGQDVTIWWRVSLWGEQFDKMMPFFKKGSSVMVYGELQKPEIFNDREGKPQVSMDITATSIHFSPFGKPDRDGPDGGGPAAAAPIPAFSKTPDGAPVNPYTKAPAMPAAQGGTFDDEIPF